MQGVAQQQSCNFATSQQWKGRKLNKQRWYACLCDDNTSQFSSSFVQSISLCSPSLAHRLEDGLSRSIILWLRTMGCFFTFIPSPSFIMERKVKAVAYPQNFREVLECCSSGNCVANVVAKSHNDGIHERWVGRYYCGFHTGRVAVQVTMGI